MACRPARVGGGGCIEACRRLRRRRPVAARRGRDDARPWGSGRRSIVGGARRSPREPAGSIRACAPRARGGASRVPLRGTGIAHGTPGWICAAPGCAAHRRPYRRRAAAPGGLLAPALALGPGTPHLVAPGGGPGAARERFARRRERRARAARDTGVLEAAVCGDAPTRERLEFGHSRRRTGAIRVGVRAGVRHRSQSLGAAVPQRAVCVTARYRADTGEPPRRRGRDTRRRGLPCAQRGPRARAGSRPRRARPGLTARGATLVHRQ